MRSGRKMGRTIAKKAAAAALTASLLLGAMPAGVRADEAAQTSTAVAATEASYKEVCALAADLNRQTESMQGTNPGYAFIGHPRKEKVFIWDTEGKKFAWTYYNGIMMDAFLMLDSAAYINNVNTFYDANVAGSTGTKTYSYNNETYNSYKKTELDSIPPTRALFDLIEAGSPADTDQKGRYKAFIGYVYKVMLEYGDGYSQCHGVVDGTNGNFNHKIFDLQQELNKNWAEYQVALDGLYMAQPFFMELANALRTEKLTPADIGEDVEEPAVVCDRLYSEVYKRMLWIGENLYDEDTHLYNHGWAPSPSPHVNGHFWLRAVGWYAAALADVIGMFPEGEAYDGYRAGLIAIEKKLFDGMIEWQDPATGMWYNVINRGTDLPKNLLETSGSALMAYAMMKSYTEGFVGDRYGEAGLRAFNGVCMNYLNDNQLENVYISSGVSETDDGYLKYAYKINEAKGVGPLMMAACYARDATKLFNRPFFKGHSLVLTGKIGVDYYLNLPEGMTAKDYPGSYVTFSGNKIDDTIEYPLAEMSPDDAGRYKFTVYVTSIQMADEVTATFHYEDAQGAWKEESDTYSVLQYIEYFDGYVAENPEQTVYSPEIISLVKALADYGHYAQAALAARNGWTVGTDYAEMANHYAESYDYAAILAEAEAYKRELTDEGSTIDESSIRVQLFLDSDTVLRVRLSAADGGSIVPVGTFHGNTYEGVQQSDGSWLIEVPGIPAAWLGDSVVITDRNGADYELKASAMTYVYASLSYDGWGESEETMKNAVCALYEYYTGTLAFKAQQ